MHAIPTDPARPGEREADPHGDDPVARRERLPVARGTCPRQVILALLDEHAQQHPLNRALSVLENGHWRALTYMELAERVRRLAARLRERFPEGDQPIAVLSESSPAWGIVALATLASRNVLVPLDTSAEPGELVTMVERVRPRLLFASPGRLDTAGRLGESASGSTEVLSLGDSLLDVALPDQRRPASDPPAESTDPSTRATALMAFTSGTTGTPKAVEIAFDSLLFQMCALTRAFALRPSDRLLSMLPLHHMLEFTAGFLCPLWCGAQIHYLHSLLPGEALREMRAAGITRMVTVPAWLGLLKRELQNRPGNGRELRASARRALGQSFEHFVCGGAPLSREISRYFGSVGVPVLEGYGLTETGPVVATNIIRHAREGSVGKPLPGTEVRITTNGEILARGLHVADRYRLGNGHAEPVADDEGWFHTGDLGRLDEDGYLYVDGRVKSTIVLPSGKNVQPEEVEACLRERPEVCDVGVVGVRRSRTEDGEEICAVVVPSLAFADNCRSAGEDTEQALRCMVTEAACALAPHKRPRRIVVRHQALPRTAAGKLKRSALMELALDGAGESS